MQMSERDESLELDIRKKIFDFISKYPGCYMREIQKKLDIPTGQLEYHLTYLKDHELIADKKSGDKRRYFVDDEVDYPDREIISIVRQEKCRKILLILLKKKEMGFSELHERFSTSKSTLSFHLKKLIDKGMIEAEKRGRRKYYSCNNKERIAQVLITYKESFLDEAVDRFVDTWLEMRS